MFVCMCPSTCIYVYIIIYLFNLFLSFLVISLLVACNAGCQLCASASVRMFVCSFIHLPVHSCAKS